MNLEEVRYLVAEAETEHSKGHDFEATTRLIKAVRALTQAVADNQAKIKRVFYAEGFDP